MKRPLSPQLITLLLISLLLSTTPSIAFVDHSLPPATRGGTLPRLVTPPPSPLCRHRVAATVRPIKRRQQPACFLAATKGSASTGTEDAVRIRGSKATVVSEEEKNSLDTTTPVLTKASKKRKASKKKKARKEKKDLPPKYWRVDTDEFILNHKAIENGEATTSTDANDDTFLRFTVRGNPLPLRRHRTSRGFVYNPSAPAQASFREIVQSMLDSHANNPQLQSPGDNDDELVPIFSQNFTLSMTIVFYTKRPKHHFVAGRPGPDRMKESAPVQTAHTRSDVDNLAKFVLDAMNGLLYHDDRQVASLHVTKLLDNREECQGSTTVHLRVLTQDNVDTVLNTTLGW